MRDGEGGLYESREEVLHPFARFGEGTLGSLASQDLEELRDDALHGYEVRVGVDSLNPTSDPFIPGRRLNSWFTAGIKVIVIYQAK